MTTTVRLNKFMRDLNLCSRREADELIARGVVTVNGALASLGQVVLPNSVVEILSEARANQQVTIAVNKPRSFTSQAVHPRPGQRYAWQLLTWDNQIQGCYYGKSGNLSGRREAIEPKYLRKLGCCGRLDVDSSGLLVFTQDGRIARKIIGEDSDVTKTYEVDVSLCKVKPQTITCAPSAEWEGLAKLRHGLWLDGEALRPADVEWRGLVSKPSGFQQSDIDNLKQWRLVITLRQGKYRQIRRMCELVGLHVHRLQRTDIGGLNLQALGLHNRPGSWRVLTPAEVDRI